MNTLLNSIRFKKLTDALESDKNMMGLLELAFQAGVAAAQEAAQHKPCQTCEALARTVMLDQPSHDTTQQRKPLTDEDADMFWNRDDGETCHGSIEEFLNDEICQGFVEVGAEFTLMQAKKLADVRIKVTSVDEEECEAEYEIIEAAHGIKE